MTALTKKLFFDFQTEEGYVLLPRSGVLFEEELQEMFVLVVERLTDMKERSLFSQTAQMHMISMTLGMVTHMRPIQASSSYPSSEEAGSSCREEMPLGVCGGEYMHSHHLHHPSSSKS